MPHTRAHDAALTAAAKELLALASGSSQSRSSPLRVADRSTASSSQQERVYPIAVWQRAQQLVQARRTDRAVIAEANEAAALVQNVERDVRFGDARDLGPDGSELVTRVSRAAAAAHLARALTRRSQRDAARRHELSATRPARARNALQGSVATISGSGAYPGVADPCFSGRRGPSTGRDVVALSLVSEGTTTEDGEMMGGATWHDDEEECEEGSDWETAADGATEGGVLSNVLATPSSLLTRRAEMRLRRFRGRIDRMPFAALNDIAPEKYGTSHSVTVATEPASVAESAYHHSVGVADVECVRPDATPASASTAAAAEYAAHVRAAVARFPRSGEVAGIDGIASNANSLCSVPRWYAPPSKSAMRSVSISAGDAGGFSSATLGHAEYDEQPGSVDVYGVVPPLPTALVSRRRGSGLSRGVTPDPSAQLSGTLLANTGRRIGTSRTGRRASVRGGTVPSVLDRRDASYFRLAANAHRPATAASQPLSPEPKSSTFSNAADAQPPSFFNTTHTRGGTSPPPPQALNETLSAGVSPIALIAPPVTTGPGPNVSFADIPASPVALGERVMCPPSSDVTRTDTAVNITPPVASATPILDKLRLMKEQSRLEQPPPQTTAAAAAKSDALVHIERVTLPLSHAALLRAKQDPQQLGPGGLSSTTSVLTGGVGETSSHRTFGATMSARTGSPVPLRSSTRAELLLMQQRSRLTPVPGGVIPTFARDLTGAPLGCGSPSATAAGLSSGVTLSGGGTATVISAVRPPPRSVHSRTDTFLGAGTARGLSVIGAPSTLSGNSSVHQHQRRRAQSGSVASGGTLAFPYSPVCGAFDTNAGPRLTMGPAEIHASTFTVNERNDLTQLAHPIFGLHYRLPYSDMLQRQKTTFGDMERLQGQYKAIVQQLHSHCDRVHAVLDPLVPSNVSMTPMLSPPIAASVAMG
jgi:hypothetical protein